MKLKPKNLIKRLIILKYTDKEVYMWVVGVSWLMGISMGLYFALGIFILL